MAATDQIVSGVPGRYANALFELANEQKSADQVGAQLAVFQSAIEESDDLTRMVRSPVYSAEDQLAAVEAIGARAGISGVALNFLRLVARNRRLSGISDMIKAYSTLLAAAKGETAAEVTSAEPLTAKQLADLKAALKASLKRDVTLSERVDPAILGGLIVKAGSQMIDNSLKTKLDNLKIAMKGTA